MRELSFDLVNNFIKDSYNEYFNRSSKGSDK